MNIKWYSYYGNATGISNAAGNNIKVLLELGHKVCPTELEGTVQPGVLRTLWEDNYDLEFDLKVLQQLPHIDESRSMDGYYAVFEFDKVPYEWREHLNNAKIIMTPAQFSKDSFVNSGIDPSKIFVVNNVVNFDTKPTVEFSCSESFKFLSIFEWVTRKRPDLMIQAFVNEFCNGEDVALILKTYTLQSVQIPKLINKYGKRDNRIYWLKDRVKNVSSLYNSVDAYVSPTAGEGFGLTLAEAMAHGLPTIGSNYSANLEFMNKSNSWLADVGDWEEIGDRGQKIFWVRPWMKWKVPDVYSIQEQMRSVYEAFKGKTKQERMRHPKIREAIKIRRQLGIGNVAKQMKVALDWYKENFKVN